MEQLFQKMGHAKEVVILQHVANENAGTVLDFLERGKIPFRTVELFKPGYTLPDLEQVRSLVVMGGPMNVYEEDKHPFLVEEDHYIRKAIKGKVPYLGVCLGSQLLAKALGAKVYKARQEEIGWSEVTMMPKADSDPLFGGLGLERIKVLQWHGDTFDLPEGSAHLASGLLVPNQAYAVSGRFYGLQFHLEVNRPMLVDWFKDRNDVSDICAEFDAYQDKLSGLTEKIYNSFFSLT